MCNAAWWIAFGPHGPRAEAPPGEWARVFLYSGIGIAISVALFLVIHSFARPPPKTMTKEWQEATNEYLKVHTKSLLLDLAYNGLLMNLVLSLGANIPVTERKVESALWPQQRGIRWQGSRTKQVSKGARYQVRRRRLKLFTAYKGYVVSSTEPHGSRCVRWATTKRCAFLQKAL